MEGAVNRGMGRSAPGAIRRRVKRGVYLLPSSLTLGNLFCGFYALIAVYNDEYFAAAIAIMLAEVFDYLDGGGARMTGATSAIGNEVGSPAELGSLGSSSRPRPGCWV